MAVVGIQPSIWVCKYHKYYKQNICSVHLKLIKVKNNFGDFSGNPQKLPWIPRKFGLSKSPKYVPKPRNCFPRPHPENRRFSGFFPRKNPKNLPSPVPTPSPKILKKFPRPHPVPELRGGGRGSPGIGVTIAHSNLYLNKGLQRNIFSRTYTFYEWWGWFESQGVSPAVMMDKWAKLRRCEQEHLVIFLGP
jgi:hypothetical protein